MNVVKYITVDIYPGKICGVQVMSCMHMAFLKFKLII